MIVDNLFFDAFSNGIRFKTFTAITKITLKSGCILGITTRFFCFFKNFNYYSDFLNYHQLSLRFSTIENEKEKNLHYNDCLHCLNLNKRCCKRCIYTVEMTLRCPHLPSALKLLKNSQLQKKISK